MKTLFLIIGMGVVFLPNMAVAMTESCIAPSPPVVNVRIAEDTAQFDLDQSQGQLEAFKTEANSGHIPSIYHNAKKSGDVLGVTVGNFASEYDIDYKYGDAIASDDVCVSIENINVTLTFRPTVYVASEYSGDQCWFSEIFGHEAKHVAIDRQITQTYQQKITDLMSFAFSEPMDYSSGRVRSDDVMQMRLMLDASVDATLASLFESMMRERNDEQLTVDNIDEYIRIAMACPAVGVQKAIPTPLPFPILNQ